MKPHGADPISLIGGLTLLLVAAGFALSDTSDVQLRWLFLVPLALVVIGAGILAVVTRRMSEPDDDDSASMVDPL